MAKLVYGPDHGTLSVRADDDKYAHEGDIEVTPEQALAVAASQIALGISNLYDALELIAHRLPQR